MSSQLNKWSCVYLLVPQKNCMSIGDQPCDVVSLGVWSGKNMNTAVIWHHKTHNSLVVQTKTHSLLSNCNNVKVLHAGLGKRMRRTVEAPHTTAGELTNHREGCISLSQAKLGWSSQWPGKHREQAGQGAILRYPARWSAMGECSQYAAALCLLNFQGKHLVLSFPFTFFTHLSHLCPILTQVKSTRINRHSISHTRIILFVIYRSRGRSEKL